MFPLLLNRKQDTGDSAGSVPDNALMDDDGDVLLDDDGDILTDDD